MAIDAQYPQVPFTFLAIPPEESPLGKSRVALLPVPYDGTATFRTGQREGPRAIIEASAHLEDYDPETDMDVASVGIHTALFLEPTSGNPGEMAERIYKAVKSLCRGGRLVGLLGGEHSIAVGAVRAFKERYPDLSVLYLDAHADMRDSYQGTELSHACVARRISEACPLVQVGVRSMSLEERDFVRTRHVPCYLASRTRLNAGTIARIVSGLSSDVYVSLDLDVLDPSLVSAVGTPEPGGLTWNEVLALLRAVVDSRRIVGFDVSELCPPAGTPASASVAATLVYKLIGCAVGTYHSKDKSR
jgi:agmatinase